MCELGSIIQADIAIILIGTLLYTILYWITLSFLRKLNDRRRWNYGKCQKCKNGKYVNAIDGMYCCDNCGYTIFLQYYDPAKDVCW